MATRRVLPVLLAGLLATPSPTVAQSFDEAPVSLLLPVGSVGVGMARAASASSGPESAFWNPAGLAGLGGSRAVLMSADGAAGRSTAFSLLVRGAPGVLGVSYHHLDTGSQEFVDAQGLQTGTLSTLSHAAVLSAAAGPVAGLRIGINLKLLSERWSCRGDCAGFGSTSNGYAVDLGVQLRPVEAIPLRLGAMVAHLGPSLQGINASQADPLPTRLRIAAAYDLLSELVEVPGIEGWLSLEVQDRLLEPGTPAVFVGSEVSLGSEDRVSVRSGYVVRDPYGGVGAALGLGIAMGRVELSVARMLEGGLLTPGREPVSVSISLGF